MEYIFLTLLNQSIAASWLVLAVFLLRFLLKRAPRGMLCLLWAFVGIRLLCPFSVESILSLVPSAETFPPEILLSPSPQIQSGIPVLNDTLNPILSNSLAPEAGASVNPMQILAFCASAIWLLGIVLLLAYLVFSILRVRRSVREAISLETGIYLCDSIDTPFLFGIFRPRIYLPSSLSEVDRKYVIAHEKAHLKRFDHLWKPLGFLFLTVYWFNPILWVAYILLCRDIEMACDERVIRQLGESGKKPYSTALINCSIPRRMIAACPIAFGEVGVKQRVRSVLHYRKPTFWILLLAVLLSVATAVCFLTNPKEDPAVSESELPGVSLEIVSLEPTAPQPNLILKWNNETDQNLLLNEEFYIYQQVNGTWQDCRTVTPYFWHPLATKLSANSSTEKIYLLDGIHMGQRGRYRFESNFTTSDDTSTKYKIQLEFTLNEDSTLSGENTFTPTALVYDCGIFSFTQTVDIAPTYRLDDRLSLLEVRKDGSSTQIGTLRQVELNAETFDSRFVSQDLWLESETLESLKAKNKTLWEAKSKDNLYLLMEQTDGTYYLAVGHCNQKSDSSNPDHSLIRWIYRVRRETKPVYEKRNSLFGSLESQDHFPMVKGLSFGMSQDAFHIALPESVDYAVSSQTYTDQFYDKDLKATVTVTYRFHADHLESVQFRAVADEEDLEKFCRHVEKICKKQSRDVYKILKNNSFNSVAQALATRSLYLPFDDKDSYFLVSHPENSATPVLSISMGVYNY